MDSTESNENATAAEQAAQAPDVASVDTTSDSTADTAATTEDHTVAATEEQMATDAQEADPSQLAADGDAVVGGLEENRTEQAPPNEGQ